MSDSRVRSLVLAALAVDRSRADHLSRIRTALLQGDNQRAITMMRVYTGIDEEEDGQESNRAHSSID